jgi:hypothetical protein
MLTDEGPQSACRPAAVQEQSESSSVSDPWQTSCCFDLIPCPTRFVVEDPNYNYISARFPGDVELMSQRIVELVKSLHESAPQLG